MLKLKLDKFSLQRIIDTTRVSRVIRAYLRDLKAEIARLMRLPKTGQRYQKPNGRFYQASAPGEAPAIRTGALSIDANYAGFLERGTARMRARPFVRPALRTVNSRFQDVRIRLG